MPSRGTHAVARVPVLFLFAAKCYSVACRSSIAAPGGSSAGGQRGCLHLSAAARCCCGHSASLCSSACSQCFWVYKEWSCCVIWYFLCLLFGGITNCFPQQLSQFMFPPAARDGSNFSHLSASSPALATFCFSLVAILVRVVSHGNLLGCDILTVRAKMWSFLSYFFALS